MSAGRLLLADDDATFLESTADLLRAEGFDCVTAPDGAAALAAVAAERFDLLITDLSMPGNTDLALVREVARLSGGLPCIVLTGFPTVRSAVACIALPVSAYLTKPLDFEELRTCVTTSVRRYRAYQAMRSAEDRLAIWRSELQQIPQPAERGGAGEIDLFLSLSLRNVMSTLDDLTHLGRALAGKPVAEHACQLMNCPRGSQLVAAVTQTIDVLVQTKSSFKSRELGALRQQLELLLETV